MADGEATTPKRTPGQKAKDLAAQPAGLPPWEPHPKWSKPRAEAFEHYRDMHNRSVRRCAADLGKSGTLIAQWAAAGWQPRVRAWDAEVSRRKQEAFLSGSADHGRRIAEQIEELREAAAAPALALLDRLKEQVAKGKDPFHDVETGELSRVASNAARAFASLNPADRLARGLSTDNRGGHDGGPQTITVVEQMGKGELDVYLLGRREEREEREAAEAALLDKAMEDAGEVARS